MNDKLTKIDKKISKWLSDYLVDNHLNSFVIGISGGIDSAVTSTLCAMTGHKTYVVVMPIHQNKKETERGMEHCVWLKEQYPNIEEIKIDLSETFDQFKSVFPSAFNNKLALANSRARIRMSSLYLIAGNNNGIVVGTGNKIEDFGVGFFTKYGDGGVDISPIADLMKSEVYSIGKSLGIVDSIMKAKPTDGLWDDERTDEDQLGVSYDELEWAMNYTGSKKDLTQEEKNILAIYKTHRNKNLHKMKNIPMFRHDAE